MSLVVEWIYVGLISALGIGLTGTIGVLAWLIIKDEMK